MSGVRSTAKWQRVRAEVLRGATHCKACQVALDFKAPPRSRWAPSVDHITPLAWGGAPFDRSNLRAVHVGCNASMGAAMKGQVYVPPPKPPRPAEHSVELPVCQGRACSCEWLGREPERCSKFASRQMVMVKVPVRAAGDGA